MRLVVMENPAHFKRGGPVRRRFAYIV